MVGSHVWKIHFDFISYCKPLWIFLLWITSQTFAIYIMQIREYAKNKNGFKWVIFLYPSRIKQMFIWTFLLGIFVTITPQNILFFVNHPVYIELNFFFYYKLYTNNDIRRNSRKILLKTTRYKFFRSAYCVYSLRFHWNLNKTTLN